jgi:hypothetical protein
MSIPADVALSDGERRAIERAFADDPWLAEELERVTGFLDPAAAGSFWRAFAARAPTAARPAAAVLGALEDAASEARARER